MEELLFDFTTVKPSWSLCFNEKCPRHTTCMRYFVGKQVPSDRTEGLTIYPNALQAGACSSFVEKRIERFAWGFRKLFPQVKRVHYATLRDSMKAYLGGHSNYYRYMRGEYMLNPKQQQWILELFGQYGYTENLLFEHYVYSYVFK